MKKLSLITAGAILGLSSAAAYSTPMSLGSIMGNNVPYTDSGASYVQLTDTDGYQDSAFATLLHTDSSTVKPTSLGIFSYGDKSNRLQLFGPNTAANTTNSKNRIWFDESKNLVTTAGPLNGPNSVSCSNVACSSISPKFGFYMTDAKGDTWYSDPKFNKNGTDHASLYETANGKYDDILNGSDVVAAFDNGSEVVGLQDVKTIASPSSSVPEPATVALLGLGLFGLAMSFYTRRSNRPNAVA